ncbi:hypothetical protein Trydic_g23021 [Trypoxylus dichotomus]
MNSLKDSDWDISLAIRQDQSVSKLFIQPLSYITSKVDRSSTICTFRKHSIVMTADIEKLYRQVKIARDQQDLQRILWRSTPTGDLQHYRLTTVTYGTASGSYLAIRDFYVDDLITGANTIEELTELKRDLSNILENYGFRLRKWMSNDRRVLDESTVKDGLLEYYITDASSAKALGILWNANVDLLAYRINEINIHTKRVKKRIILSHIAQIFDPLGLLAPATVTAKIMMQRLWQLKLEWDESVPFDVYTACARFFKNISLINELNIKRHCVIEDAVKLHCYCDASIEAYGACVYVVSTNKGGGSKSGLLCAKSRFAPLKSVTLPRLELCGVLLLVELVDRVLKALQTNINNIWVSQIQQLSNVSKWGHVPSLENPADVISKGTDAHVLLESTMWYHGPSWLVLSEDKWPKRMTGKVDDDTLEKRKPKPVCLNVLKKVVGYCFRFIRNAKLSREYRTLGTLTNEELDSATKALLKLAQAQEFSQEIDSQVLENRYDPKVNPSRLEQRMGDLPDHRVNVSRPFLATGVDYAGPFDMRDGRLRNRKIVKGYICLFVCFSIKAVHMELVGDLSADSFLNALKRFTARRGKVILNYEEFYIVITQIEAVLNSRPLAPLTNDLIALSPSHFLIGDYLTAIPQEKVQPPLNRTRRYKQLQQIAQHFWRRWSREYLSSIQQRTKWKGTSSSQLNPGTMVMLREDHLPPLLWKIGRVIASHPGSDGLVRVVSVRTTNGVVKRAVQKICVLPIESE